MTWIAIGLFALGAVAGWVRQRRDRRNLDRLGRLVNVRRFPLESNAKYRRRIVDRLRLPPRWS